MKPNIPLARGFTLIEMIIVIIVIGIMAAALAPLAMTSLQAYDATHGDVVALDKLRYATERLAREIREVNYDNDPTHIPSLGFNFMSGSTEYTSAGMGLSSMKFKRRFYDSAGNESTADVTIDTTVDAVRLHYSTVAVVAQVLTDELGALTFSYLDKDGVATATVTDVRSVVISLTLTHNGNPYTQRTQVQLKNRS